MRNLKGLFLIVLMGVALLACSANETQTVTLQTEINGTTLEFTYKAEGDRVIEQSANNVMPYEALGVTSAEEAEAILGSIAEDYSNTEGVTHSIDYQDDQLVEKLTINFEEADLEALSQLPGVMIEDPSAGISLKKSVELLEEEGFEVVE